MPDIFDYLLEETDEPMGPERTKVLASTLRRQQNLGVLGELMGTKPTMAAGQSLQKQATGSLAEALEKQKEARRAKIEQARYDAEIARANEEREDRRSRDATHDRQWQAMFGLKQAAAEDKDNQPDYKAFRTEDGMRGQYDRQMASTNEELAAIGKIKQLAPGMLGRVPSAVEQQSMVILLNKFLDPGSVVREGEFNRVIEAQGLDNRASNLLAKIMEGKPLGPDMIQDINAIAELYERASLARGKKISQGYWDTAVRRNVDPYAVVMDPQFQPGLVPDTVGAGPPPGAVRLKGTTATPVATAPGGPAMPTAGQTGGGGGAVMSPQTNPGMPPPGAVRPR